MPSAHRWSSASPRMAEASGGPWSAGPRPPRRHLLRHPPPWKVCTSGGRREAGGGSPACGADLSRRLLLVPPDLGPQTGTSPGRLVRSQQLPPSPAFLPWRGRDPDSLPLFLRSLPLSSRCPFKALSGRKFDYRVFAALPSSRPVYDMQVPGPPALLQDTLTGFCRFPLSLSPSLSPAPYPPCPAPAPAPPARALQGLTQAPVGGFRQVWVVPDQPFSPSQSPDFAEELRSLEPPPSPGELAGQGRAHPRPCPRGPGCQAHLLTRSLPLPAGLPEEDGEVAMVLLGRPSPSSTGPEEVALCSSRRAVRPGRRGLGPVPS